jgi:hypothetical protein
MGCDDVLKVDEFFVVRDYIDDMSGLLVEQHNQD